MSKESTILLFSKKKKKREYYTTFVWETLTLYSFVDESILSAVFVVVGEMP